MNEMEREANGCTKRYNRRFRQFCDVIADKNESIGLNNFSRSFSKTGMRFTVLRIEWALDEVKDLIKAEKQITNRTLSTEIDRRLDEIARYAIATLVERREVNYKRSELYPEKEKKDREPADVSKEQGAMEKAFEMQGFDNDPITDEEWEAMEKYPPVPLSEYQDIEKQVIDDYKKAIENRPGYPWSADEATVERYLDATKELIVENINQRKVFPFEVVADGTFMFLPKNRRRIEGDYVVVAK